jgi:hypothetical protein
MAPHLYKMSGLNALSHQRRGRHNREEEGSEINTHKIALCLNDSGSETKLAQASLKGASAEVSANRLAEAGNARCKYPTLPF